MMFMAATERPMEVAEGVGRCGRRSELRCTTAMTELRVVRGSWPRPAVRMPVAHAEPLGREMWGCQRVGVGRGMWVVSVRVRESVRPRTRAMSAKGVVGRRVVRAKARKVQINQMWLSVQLGPRKVSLLRALVPAAMTREKPAPSCMPFTIGMGIVRVKSARRPVTEKRRRQRDTKMPAALMEGAERFLRRATAAMAFMGWTGRGMPYRRPVAML